jgi:hypothetical protein
VCAGGVALYSCNTPREQAQPTRVTSNLTVAATTPEPAEAELTAAWTSLTEMSQQAASDLG